MNREISHEYGYRHYVETAHADRADAIARLGFLAIAGADRSLRRTFSIVGEGLGQLVQRWQDYRARRATYRALAALDDRLLRDIGLTRADIELGPDELTASLEEAVSAPVFAPAVVANADLKRAA